ncbi:MAG: type II toxin-antitoxin system PemK/MazF family toxin [Oscillospiraceae bacterium]|nr:type II toxin-antitoxin system PemK/MazF family toxin [Oscillospiraceae bacterium]
MGKFVKGDIVVIPFPFSDLSSSKRRPALVLVDLKGDDLILCQITSQSLSDDMAVTVGLTDVEKGALNVVSNIRPNRLFTADENIVLYKIGQLKKDKMDDVIAKIKNMFK